MGAAMGGGWGWGAGWGHNDVTINNNNNFNRNANVNRNANINGGNRANAGNNWQHNSAHRGGAPYSDRGTANKYGGTARGDSLANRQAGARQQVSRQGGNLGSNAVGTTGLSNRAGAAGGLGDRAAAGGVGDRAGSGGLSNRAGNARSGQFCNRAAPCRPHPVGNRALSYSCGGNRGALRAGAPGGD